MKKDVTELKKMFVEILQNPALASHAADYARQSLDSEMPATTEFPTPSIIQQPASNYGVAINNQQPIILKNDVQPHEVVEETLNIMDKEKELIIKALKKHKSKRKDAAADLGISERTLYRKLNEYDIENL
jgi:DNA-binding NtrC family response regulator